MKVSLFLVEGFETVEALAVADVLKRGGVAVDMISVMNQEYVKSAQNITVKSDFKFAEYNFDNTDLFFLPGGPGTSNYEKSQEFLDLIKSAFEKGMRIAAICAAPSILGHLGILKGKKATCFPGYEKDLYDAKFCPERVVTDGNVTTSRGMGTSIDLGLELVGLLVSEEKAKEVALKSQYVS